MSLKNFSLLHPRDFLLVKCRKYAFYVVEKNVVPHHPSIAKFEMENRNVTFSIGGALVGGVMSISVDLD